MSPSVGFRILFECGKLSPGSLATAGSGSTLENYCDIVEEFRSSSGPSLRGLEMEGSAVFSGHLPGKEPRPSWGKFG